VGGMVVAGESGVRWAVHVRLDDGSRAVVWMTEGSALRGVLIWRQ